MNTRTQEYAIGKEVRQGVEVNSDGDPIALVYGETLPEARALAERIVLLLNAESVA